jgi:hypothetical protein
MPDPLSIATLVSLKGAEKFAQHRDRSRAQAKEEEMEAMRRILQALGRPAGGGGGVQPQQGAATVALQEANQQLDPLAQQMLAQLFSKITGGGGG